MKDWCRSRERKNKVLRSTAVRTGGGVVSRERERRDLERETSTKVLTGGYLLDSRERTKC